MDFGFFIDTKVHVRSIIAIVSNLNGKTRIEPSLRTNVNSRSASIVYASRSESGFNKENANRDRTGVFRSRLRTGDAKEKGEDMKELANNRALGISSRLKPGDDPEKRHIECPKCSERFHGPDRALKFENHFSKKHGAPREMAVSK